jgi:hypothetical protein
MCIVCILPLSHSLVAHEAGQTILRRHQELGTALRRLLTGIGASTEFTLEKRGGPIHGGIPIWGWVKTLVPLVNPKIAGKWMFIRLKMVSIGIDPSPYLVGLLQKSK